MEKPVTIENILPVLWKAGRYLLLRHFYRVKVQGGGCGPSFSFIRHKHRVDHIHSSSQFFPFRYSMLEKWISSCIVFINPLVLFPAYYLLYMLCTNFTCNQLQTLACTAFFFGRHFIQVSQ